MSILGAKQIQLEQQRWPDLSFEFIYLQIDYYTFKNTKRKKTIGRQLPFCNFLSASLITKVRRARNAGNEENS